jgi:hypothetical protein
MTAEKRTLIAPKDILGMECECPHCHARLSISIGRIDSFPPMCPNCQKRWITEIQPSSSEVAESAILNHFIRYLVELQSSKLSTKIRFEISGDVQSPHDATPQGKTA